MLQWSFSLLLPALLTLTLLCLEDKFVSVLQGVFCT